MFTQEQGKHDTSLLSPSQACSPLPLELGHPLPPLRGTPNLALPASVSPLPSARPWGCQDSGALTALLVTGSWGEGRAGHTECPWPCPGPYTEVLSGTESIHLPDMGLLGRSGLFPALVDKAPARALPGECPSPAPHSL